MEEAMVEQVIDKSRFIAHIKPVETREEAEEFFRKIREKHRKATHNVPTYVIGEKFELQWASDDGEPQGTAGAPMVQMLVKEGITNVAVIVTRYFGGIKLGTGGLVRAYTGSAKQALEKAHICDVKEQDVLQMRIDYSYYDKLQNLAVHTGFDLQDVIYSEVIIVNLCMEPWQKEKIKTLVCNLTGGTCKTLKETQKLVKISP